MKEANKQASFWTQKVAPHVSAALSLTWFSGAHKNVAQARYIFSHGETETWVLRAAFAPPPATYLEENAPEGRLTSWGLFVTLTLIPVERLSMW